jgi:hypothetical protein
MKISSTESEAATVPVLSTVQLYMESVYFGVTSAIFVKPSSDLVYLLKKSGSTYYIGHFSKTELTITYKQAFYHCDYGSGNNPRGIFKDETNFFATLNCAYNFNYDYASASGYFLKYSIGTSYY